MGASQEDPLFPNQLTLPQLPLPEWEDTKETLHRYCQVVGKLNMEILSLETTGDTSPYTCRRGGSPPARSPRGTSASPPSTPTLPQSPRVLQSSRYPR
jgi:hypothetical protein